MHITDSRNVHFGDILAHAKAHMTFIENYENLKNTKMNLWIFGVCYMHSMLKNQYQLTYIVNMILILYKTKILHIVCLLSASWTYFAISSLLWRKLRSATPRIYLPVYDMSGFCVFLSLYLLLKYLSMAEFTCLCNGSIMD